ncbi:MAG: GYD domain-containing protein [Actinomycetota bacterium]
MPKYLIKGRYAAEGARGLLDEGGTARAEAARKAVESVGGTLESYYFAFGETDVYAIADFPDTAAVVATALTIGSSGKVGVETVVLLTPAEVDAASKLKADYTPPGG